jgi:tyrosyl-tRNA synthetase
MGRNFIEEFRWRGMLQDMTPGLEDFITKEQITGYIGFDPTATSLHIGNLATIILLIHLQNAGHKPIALVGGATGMIGDPSGKSAERNLLDSESISQNVAAIKKQLERFLDFSQGPCQAEVVNNLDWFGEMSAIDFLRTIGKHLTVNYMLSKDSVQSRMETGLSFTEFSYQLLQGYDFQWLYKNKNCRLQLGGSDQWGNITAGTELIRRMGGAQDAFAVTTPLITKSDGSKFGKSEDGNIWLDPALTSPYQFFQFFLNVSDDEALPLLKRFTFLNKEKIEQLNTEHLVDPSARILQKALAEEVTKLVHKEEGLITAKLTTDVLFGKGTLSDLENISEAQFESVLSGVPRGIIQKEEFETDWINVLSNGSQNLIFPSKSEAKKMIQAGAVVINKVKISEPAISEYNLLRGKFLLIQKGKKNYFLLEYVQ